MLSLIDCSLKTKKLGMCAKKWNLMAVSGTALCSMKSQAGSSKVMDMHLSLALVMRKLVKGLIVT